MKDDIGLKDLKCLLKNNQENSYVNKEYGVLNQTKIIYDYVIKNSVKTFNIKFCLYNFDIVDKIYAHKKIINVIKQVHSEINLLQRVLYPEENTSIQQINNNFASFFPELVLAKIGSFLYTDALQELIDQEQQSINEYQTNHDDQHSTKLIDLTYTFSDFGK